MGTGPDGRSPDSSVGSGMDGGSDAIDEGDASGAADGRGDGPVTCTVSGRGGSSGTGPGPDGGLCSNMDVTLVETCNDGTQYRADCYCLSCGASNCCCSNSDAACGGFTGEGGVPYSGPCDAFFGPPGPFLAACGFPPLTDQ
jgi:hypothetical protein